MKMTELRKNYPELILAGGIDNTGTMINGPLERIQAEAREIIDMGRDGGVIIGSGYTGPDISLQNFAAYHEVCLAYGDFDV